jgi:uncharacterized membrane protein YcfT
MIVENPLGISANGFAALECVHIAGFALAIGMTALVDFRLLGFGLLSKSPAEIARSFDLWSLGGLIVAVFSGLLIFSTDPDTYYLNWSFLLKMAALVLAVVFQYTVHRRALLTQLPRSSAVVIASVSLLLWTSVIFGGIFIAVVRPGLG